jgi:hypothetical protein
MANSWDLTLCIDAHGHDDTQVTVIPGVGGGSAHLKVRAGLVVAHCLDAQSAMSAARAWAAATLTAQTWQPQLRDTQSTPKVAAAGAAYPLGSLLLEGRQPWHANRIGHALAVTVGPLQVRVHDMIALDTHVRVWSEAAAIATRLFPGRAVPFARLVELERRDRLRAVDEPIDRRYDRRRPGPPAPGSGPTPGGERPGPERFDRDVR